ncbi:MAG: His/Gly/Thr/Pro-type tRNA ligase C-terminal domain-containing protein [Candidatus Pacebacteria bacterium]|nr:His/Gly/Thr/Pro-type tRNA ligase C-terminal domain-containing protein [Candidatus Paceibacterota bacterium]
MPTLQKKRAADKKEEEVREMSRRERKRNEPRYTFLEKADEIALYYGFVPIATPRISKRDTLVAKLFREIEPSAKESGCELSASLCLEEKISVLRTYMEMNMQDLPQPVMFYYKGPIAVPARMKKSSLKNYGLEILGTGKSMAEAIIIKTALTILSDEGYENLTVEINSVGDKDSTGRFIRELTNYYRKNLGVLPAECRQTFKKDTFELLSCDHEKCKELAEDAPQSLSFLSEDSRTHFKEVLEYLETLDIPYTINNHLIGKKGYGQSVFEIRSGDSKDPIAIGMRYDSITKKIGLKKEIPAVGVSLAYKQLQPEKLKKVKGKLMKRPKFYFVQLGFEAKLKSLKVLEILRQAKIPLYQSLSKDKLVGQITSAENLKIPYAIIMGQKEAMEDSVIVRHMETRAQETVKIENLQRYIEKIK